MDLVISRESARRTQPAQPLDFENTSEIPPLKEVIGQDYAVFSHNMDAVDGLGSDGDGYENGEELEAGTLPGFSNSYPDKKGAGLDIRLVVALVVLLGAVLGLGGRALRKRKPD